MVSRFDPMFFAVLTGVLLILSFPPFGLGFLAWGALVPLMLALDSWECANWKRAFLTGLASGFVFYLGTVYWVVNSMYFYGGVPIYTSVPVMALLSLILAVYTGLFAVIFASASRHGGLTKLLLMPIAWVGLEYLRAHLFTGFPWVLLGYSQFPYLPLVQIADITGVWGVAFAVVMVNAAIFLYIKSAAEKERTRPLREVIIAASLFVALFVYGVVRMKQVDNDALTWRGVRVGVAQGNIDQSKKWDASFQRETIEIYRGLTRNAVEAGAGIVIWPETAAPFFLGAGPDDAVKTALVGGVAKETKSFIITGSPSYEHNPVERAVDYFNSAVLFSPMGGIVGKYDKTHLVPFGEYVPMKRFLPFIKKLTAGVGDFKEGPGPVPIKIGAEPGAAFGILICYEAIFPEIAAGAVRNGADILVNITNDAWFGRSSAPYQHFDMSAMRAIENRTYLLRSANTGISAIVDPAGRVRQKTALFEKTVINGMVGLRKGDLTIYSRFGDVFAYFCLAMLGAFIAIKAVSKKV